MNREILFRGKNIDDGHWVYGTPISLRNGETHMNFEIMGWIDRTIVIPETVGQYTGLKDKNETKIFEGDVVRVFDGEYINYAVSFDGKHGAFVIGNASFWYYVPDIEVIGNIYDNPELMEDKENE